MLKQIAVGAVPVVVALGWAAYTYGPGKKDTTEASASSTKRGRANPPAGSFKATGGKLGTWEMKVTGCRSGQKHGFSGVVFFDEADKARHVRIVQGGAQPQVIVQLAEGKEPIVVQKCRTVDVKIKQTGSSINFQDELAGSVTLTCPSFGGSATFPSCY